MTNRVTPENITSLEPHEIFVFGSNLEGIHGKGAAKTAVSWGAKRGIGNGISGKTYAIPTRKVKKVIKGRTFNKHLFESITLLDIAHYIGEFTAYAEDCPDKTFLVTQIGCGNAGFTPEQIAPMFKDAVAIENICLPKSFWDVLSEKIILYKGPATREDFDEFLNNVEQSRANKYT